MLRSNRPTSLILRLSLTSSKGLRNTERRYRKRDTVPTRRVTSSTSCEGGTVTTPRTGHFTHTCTTIQSRSASRTSVKHKGAWENVRLLRDTLLVWGPSIGDHVSFTRLCTSSVPGVDDGLSLYWWDFGLRLDVSSRVDSNYLGVSCTSAHSSS